MIQKRKERDLRDELDRIGAVGIVYHHLTGEELLEHIDNPFGEDAFYRAPKQLLDAILRTTPEEDALQFPTDNIPRDEIILLIKNGLVGIDLTFERKKLLHAILAAFDAARRPDGSYPPEIFLTRAELCRLMGEERKKRADGSSYAVDATGRQRRRDDKNLRWMADQKMTFLVSTKTGRVHKKTGEPLYDPVWKQRAIFEIDKQYHSAEQKELPGILEQRPAGEKRFKHYHIKLNLFIVGEVNRYFRYLPLHLAKQISDFRTGTGGRASSAELNFLEYLYHENREVIEINCVKLAEKLKIKKLDRLAVVRKAVNRCYKTARALGYVLDVKLDAPAARGSKDVIRCNPAKFRYIRMLKSGQEPAVE